MTDEERGKSQDAEEEGTPSEAPSPPTPPPPDVSMFDDALEPLEMPDMAGADAAPPRMASSPDLGAKSDEDEGAVREEQPSQLDLSDAVDEEVDSGRSSAPDSDWGPEPKSARRARITLKIPDDDVPLSSKPPRVEKVKKEPLASTASVVQAMRIISIGEAAQPAKEDESVEQLAPEDQLDMEPLGAHDVESTWTPPTGQAAPPPRLRREEEEQLRSEDLEAIQSEPSLARFEEEEEIEPETDEDHVPRPPPVTVVERPARAESPAPSPTAPLSPSASAPPPPMRGPQGSSPRLAPIPLPEVDDEAEQPVRGFDPLDEPSALELDDEEIAPSSDAPGTDDEDLGQALPPPPPPPAAPMRSAFEVPAPTPMPAAADMPPPPTAASPDETPSPPRPPAPPPPKKRAKSELGKRDRRARPGWEEVFADEFVRAYPRLTNKQVDEEVTFVEKSLGIQRGGVVLDLGCGSGQHAVELASRGYNVVGYDLSLTMLAMAADEAQERGQKINFLQGDMREMAFEEMFDGIFSWGTSFGFFDEEKNISVIQRVHRALRKGGMFLLDLVNRDYICARLPSLAWFEGDGCVCIDDAQFNSITSRLRVKRTIMIEDGTSREVEYTVRLYSLHEIGKILHEAGFKVVEVSGHPATTGAFFDAESPRVITLAVRR
jgi:SAM-dependent methyltransferase